MENLSFDTGLIELAIQNDQSRILRINPTDGRMVEGFLALIANSEVRLKEFQIKEEGLNAKKGMMDDIEFMKSQSILERETDKFLRNEFDSIFGAGTSDMVFQEASASALASNGDYVFMNFMMALFPYFDKEIKNRSRKVADIIQDHKKAAKKVK